MALNDGYAYLEQIGPRAQGRSVLEFLTGHYPHSSGQEWQERLRRGEVLLEGRVASGSETLKAGQTLVWQRPPWEEEDVPLDYTVLFEDEALVAVAKPGGLPTLPGGGFYRHTLLSRVRQRYPQASPLHRLGRGTSGVVLFARSAEAASRVARAWREHAVHKRYRALASGVAREDAYEITTPIGPVPHARLRTVFAASPSGKASYSLARVLERRADATLFQVDIRTGRPHQIRVHLASLGHPLVGDPLYGPGGLPLPHLPGLPGDGGYLLHAEQLRFDHPLSGEPLTLRAPIPAALCCAGELEEV
ncbi:23S rRNA pseudouridine1911/1915/1917 synthase [Deinobacterium chartae]|uniref:Pseudouridine synthase n=1 Tax=Deinobacterium chartae TaxID=521158 RepID=A0A841HVG8_9DEIO|nr:RluA family pseudouridine synthase [Deinobacterium chartae]MBB6096823.1 23S rRNA pseudouridine1911/1915/1917 synthase [Deinobacterium chartae]